MYFLSCLSYLNVLCNLLYDDNDDEGHKPKYIGLIMKFIFYTTSVALSFDLLDCWFGKVTKTVGRSPL